MLDHFFFLLLNIVFFTLLYYYRNSNIIFLKFYFLCFYIYFLPAYIDYINNQITLSPFYITYVCLCNIFLIFGFVLSYKKNESKITIIKHANTYGMYNYFYFIILLTTLYYKFSEIGWSFQGLMQAYLKSETENEFQISIIQNFLSVFLISSTLFFWTETKNNSFISKINTVLLFSIGLFFLLRGNRNPIMLLFLPILVYFLVKKNLFKFRYLFLFGILGYFVADYIDAFRANGLENLLNNNNAISRTYDLKSVGEFGVQSRVWEWIIGPNWNFNNFYYGATYFIHPVLNILTSVGVSFITISGQYSNILSSSDKIVGIGFSPYVEAFINFGYFGPIFFVFIGTLLSYINNKHNYNIKKSNFLKYRLFFIFPLILNFNRIDFSVLFKFYFIYWISTWLLIFLISKFKFIK